MFEGVSLDVAEVGIAVSGGEGLLHCGRTARCRKTRQRQANEKQEEGVKVKSDAEQRE